MDGGTLDSLLPSCAKASQGSPCRSSPRQAVGYYGEGGRSFWNSWGARLGGGECPRRVDVLCLIRRRRLVWTFERTEPRTGQRIPYSERKDPCLTSILYILIYFVFARGELDISLLPRLHGDPFGVRNRGILAPSPLKAGLSLPCSPSAGTYRYRQIRPETPGSPQSERAGEDRIFAVRCHLEETD
jgi:hypothetical protein